MTWVNIKVLCLDAVASRNCHGEFKIKYINVVHVSIFPKRKSK